MILKTTTTAAQEFKVIPRVYAQDFSFSVRNESTNVEKIYEVTSATTTGDYLVFSQVFSPVLVENQFYEMKLYSDPNFWNTNYFLWQLYDEYWNIDTTEIIDIYKDKIFVTDQDIDQGDNKYYDLNKDQYTTNNSYNNEYIVI